jgi:hypothetical protein
VEQKASFGLVEMSRLKRGKQSQRRTKMRNGSVGLAALALVCSAGLAFAQTAAPAAEPVAKAPANATSTQAEKPPLTGANSFTEDQARERIAEAGFQGVKDLKKDESGIWRGQATKGGQAVAVALDFRGNVVQQ